MRFKVNFVSHEATSLALGYSAFLFWPLYERRFGEVDQPEAQTQDMLNGKILAGYDDEATSASTSHHGR